MPATAALRLDTATIKFVRNLAKRPHAGRPDALNQRRHLTGEAIRFKTLRLATRNRDCGHVARVA
jgi:hypothetical protein